MSTEIIAAPETALATTSGVDPTVQWAMQNGATPEMLRELYQLQREMRADQARIAFHEAVEHFKANAPTISKNKHVSFKNKAGDITEYDHATHDHVVDVLMPALATVGLTHRWLARQDDGMMTVTCVLTHRMGHSEEAILKAAYDQSGGKNSIQAVVSAKTYLERHTFLAVTGMSTKGGDDDGKAAGKQIDAVQPPGMPDTDAITWLERIEGAQSLDELQGVFKKAYTVARAIPDAKAMQQFEAAKDRRKAQL